MNTHSAKGYFSEMVTPKRSLASSPQKGLKSPQLTPPTPLPLNNPNPNHIKRLGPKFLLIFLFLLSSLPLNVEGAIASVGEPDWSIAKADLVDELYSYEPYATGRELRSIFPFFRQPLQPQPNQNQNQRSKVKPQTFPNQQNPSRSSIFPNSNPQQQPQPSTSATQRDSYLPQVPQPQPLQVLISNDPKPTQDTSIPPPAPKYTKFSINDKKIVDSSGQYSHLQAMSTSKPLSVIGPVYEHQGPTLNPNPTNPTTLGITTTTKPISTKRSFQNTQNFGNIENHNLNQNYGNVATASNISPNFQHLYPDSTAVDSQTIIWPENVEQNLMTNDEETQVRFLVHKPGDEDIIKGALVEDGQTRNQEVKFIEGPMLRIQRHQKVYLPPKRKTVVYILLKEPQIVTDVEVVGPTEEPVPEVFITYQKSDGNVKTKHYSPEVVKNDKYLSQLRNSAMQDPTLPLAEKEKFAKPTYDPMNYLLAESQRVESVALSSNQKEQEEASRRQHARSVNQGANPNLHLNHQIMCPTGHVTLPKNNEQLSTT